ncbi:FliM/FliN family flagellar motor switch protein [Tropicimonas sp. IMCC34011]|uniref:FliM/FliN family flagellar motor switch protein n=1 Tax=Tropicimonas sp. IMCC34011 TaxID=2248759 RepID=UPI000E222888|nr:FliM/FliN family flagellar motor switch protein [Tropicimonas sp. IMCC34011]
MADTSRRTDPGGRVPTPERALSHALSKVADDEIGLVLQVSGVETARASLPELLELLPEDGLLALLDGFDGAQGVISLDQALFGAAIEMQMTSELGRVAPQPRRPTRTDAALLADLIDGALSGMGAMLAGREEARWAAGWGYSSHLPEIRPLGLMLEETEYRSITLKMSLGVGTGRTGELRLFVPAIGRGPVSTSPGGGDEDAGDSWGDRLRQNVLEADVPLDAILCRLPMRLSEAGRLAVGDVLPIPVAALGEVELVAGEAGAIRRGCLGQIHGLRALRLGPADGTPPVTDEAPAGPAFEAMPGPHPGPDSRPAPAPPLAAMDPHGALRMPVPDVEPMSDLGDGDGGATQSSESGEAGGALLNIPGLPPLAG